jgi:large subunit ribosomal protein L20
MPRSTNNVAHKKRKKKYLKAAKGYVGGRSKLYRTARQAVEKGWQYAYRDRKAKKRQFRRLWITRINAAARLNELSYSKLINGLKKADVAIDRKVLAHLAMHDSQAFGDLCKIAKEQLS